MKKFCIFIGVVLAGICWLAFSVMDFDGLSDSSSSHLQSAKAIRDVLDKGGSVNTVLSGLIANHEKDSLIHGAIYYDDLELFRQLMRRHADIKIRDESGRTPLIFAALFNRHEMVKMLLEAGADPNERDHSKQTALHWVAQNGGKESAELLLSHGADMYALDSEGKTPAEQHHYNMMGENDNIMSVLVRHGLDLSGHNLSAYSLMQDRIEDNDLEGVTEILKREPALTAEQCNDCLQSASKHKAIIKILALYVKKHFGTSDKIHYPLFETIVDTRDLESAILLIKLGADVKDAASKIGERINGSVHVTESASPEQMARELIQPFVNFESQERMNEAFEDFCDVLPTILTIAVHVLLILIPTLYLCFASSWRYILIPGFCIGFMYLLIPDHPASGDIQGMEIVILGLGLDIFLMLFMTIAALVKYKHS